MTSQSSPEQAIVSATRAEQPSLFGESGALFGESGPGPVIDEPRKTVFSIGHSTRKLSELIEVLQRYGIARVADIRHFPASRHNPQFNKAALEVELPAAGIEYFWIERLGGYRTGGYLAHMETADFRAGLGELERLAGQRRTAYMCAELLWFKCHRRRVSDALADRGWRVIHILDVKHAEEHRLKSNRIKCD